MTTTTDDARADAIAVTVCSMGSGTFEVPGVPRDASVGDLAARIGVHVDVAHVRLALFRTGGTDEPLAWDAPVVDAMQGASEVFMLLRPPLSDFAIRLSVYYGAGDTVSQDPLEQFQYGVVSALDVQDGTLALPEPVGERLGENEVVPTDTVPTTDAGAYPARLPLYLVRDRLYSVVQGGHTLVTIGKNQSGYCLLQQRTVIWEATRSDYDTQGVLEFVAVGRES